VANAAAAATPHSAPAKFSFNSPKAAHVTPATMGAKYFESSLTALAMSSTALLTAAFASFFEARELKAAASATPP